MASPAYFRSLDESRFAAQPSTTGPWHPQLQHGGPPSALLVLAAERTAAAERDDLVPTRLGAEFLGPVPVGEVTVQTRVLRAARTAMLVSATASAGGRECLHARVWFVRRADTSAVAPPLPPPVTVGGAETGLGMSFPYHDTIEWRSLGASMVRPGPGATWARPRLTVLPEVALSGLQRVALVGDSSNGISSELSLAEWSFVNVDLDVHLSRPFVGEWVHLDARTTLGAYGAAQARSTVSDVHGEVGSTAQTLVLAPQA